MLRLGEKIMPYNNIYNARVINVKPEICLKGISATETS